MPGADGRWQCCICGGGDRRPGEEDGVGTVVCPIGQVGQGWKGEDAEQEGGAETGCGLCFIAVVVQFHGWSTVGRRRSLTPLLPGATVALYTAAPCSIGSSELGPAPVIDSNSPRLTAILKTEA